VGAEAAQTMYASARAVEGTFDRSVTGKNNAALDADNELMFCGIPRRQRFTTALESLQTLFNCITSGVMRIAVAYTQLGTPGRLIHDYDPAHIMVRDSR
jgi:hypothetical protein